MSTSRSPTTRRRTASASTSTPDALLAQIEAVRELNDRVEGIELLIGTETNVLPDGTVDYDDDAARAARLGRSPRCTPPSAWASAR